MAQNAQHRDTKNKLPLKSFLPVSPIFLTFWTSEVFKAAKHTHPGEGEAIVGFLGWFLLPIPMENKLMNP